MIRVLGNVLLLISALEATAFVVVYWLTAPWWRLPDGRPNTVGRNIMSLMFVLAAVLDLSVVRVFVPANLDTPWFLALRLAVFALVPVVLGMRLRLLIKVQVLERRNGKEGSRPGR